MLFFTVVEVVRVRNSRNMMAWSLLLAAFSKVSALSFQYLIINCRVKMWWGSDSKWARWKGTVLMIGCPATNTNDDNIPLSSMKQHDIEVEDTLTSNEAIDIGAGLRDLDESTLEEAVKVLDSSSIIDELMGESE